MKKPKSSDHKGLNPNKAKRRPDGWQPSPVKKISVDRNHSMPRKTQGK